MKTEREMVQKLAPPRSHEMRLEIPPQREFHIVVYNLPTITMHRVATIGHEDGNTTNLTRAGGNLLIALNVNTVR